MKQHANITLLIIALAVLALSAGCMDSYQESSDSPGATASSSGGGKATSASWTGNAKDFTYTTFAGMSGKASDFAGKPLVVNFWAAW